MEVAKAGSGIYNGPLLVASVRARTKLWKPHAFKYARPGGVFLWYGVGTLTFPSLLGGKL